MTLTVTYNALRILETVVSIVELNSRVKNVCNNKLSLWFDYSYINY